MPNQLMIPFFIFTLSLAPTHSHGSTFALDTSAGTQTWSAGFTYDDQVPLSTKSDADHFINWSAGYTLTQSNQTDPLTGKSLIDKTSEVAGTITLERRKQHEIGLGMVYSSTPEENLKSFGPNALLAMTFNFGAPTGSAPSRYRIQNKEPGPQKSEFEDFEGDQSEGKDSIPNRLKITLSGGYVDYTQTFVSTPPRKKNVLAKPITGTGSIGQSNLKLQAKWNIHSFGLKLNHREYFYDRDVQKFESNLDSTRFAGKLSGLSTTVAGFPQESSLAGLDYEFNESYSLEIFASRTSLVTDGSLSWEEGCSVTKTFGAAFTVELGYTHSTSATSQDDTGTLNLTYDM